MAELVIYTDGACRGNPGPGGYGIILQWGHVRKEMAQGYRKTTNNRMELMAVIAAIEMLTRDKVSITIYSDSSYVVNAVEKGWLFGWIKTGFKGKKNADLWTRFYTLYKKHTIKFIWVKGHADNPMNNRCDELATAAADGGNLLIDTGYEQSGGLV
jgi:ribonuclease HI